MQKHRFFGSYCVSLTNSVTVRAKTDNKTKHLSLQEHY